ncbi:MAG: Fe-S cluster assembly protein SufB [Acholeplasmatales bacterium]|nr:Fe-S cluster assembly protein SufB [Acholeplasmatales bacterium]
MAVNESITLSSVKEVGVGLTLEKVLEISNYKKEPKWMTNFRVKCYKYFMASKNPKFGPSLDKIDFQAINYYIKQTSGVVSTWEDVPSKIKDTFEKIGIPEAEKNFLAGVSTQFESEVVYHSTKEELDKQGVIFLDTDTALKKYPKLFKKYFNTIVKYNDNKYSALNGAVWSGGSFIYVPKGVTVTKPLQSYFRINARSSGQFERTLIVVDDDSSLNYVEGCTAPLFSEDNLHAAVVEILVGKNAKCRYSTIQNWSNNVINLVTKRAYVLDNGLMEWIDGNIGSGLNMKYPSCILAGPYASGSTISIAVASKNQIQDTGAKMIHLAPHTKSQIISKSISKNGGEVNYRGLVKITSDALYSKSHVECDTLLLDNISRSDTIPTNTISNTTSFLEHEASVSKINEEQLYYLMSRGLSKKDATELLVMGFLEPFARELPMEYAVELNQLIKLEMEGSIG